MGSKELKTLIRLDRLDTLLEAGSSRASGGRLGAPITAAISGTRNTHLNGPTRVYSREYSSRPMYKLWRHTCAVLEAPSLEDAWNEPREPTDRAAEPWRAMN